MAKRQVTWFKREKDVIYINPFEFDNNEKIVDYMVDKIDMERKDNEQFEGYICKFRGFKKGYRTFG